MKRALDMINEYDKAANRLTNTITDLRHRRGQAKRILEGFDERIISTVRVRDEMRRKGREIRDGHAPDVPRPVRPLEPESDMDTNPPMSPPPPGPDHDIYKGGFPR